MTRLPFDTAMALTLRAATATLLLLFAVAIAAPAAFAQAGDVQALTDNIRRLERQLQTLERTVYRGQTPPASATLGAGEGRAAGMPQLQVATGQLEEQVRRLTGQIEEMDHRIRQLGTRLDTLVADVDFRLQALEQGGPPDAASAPDGERTGAGANAAGGSAGNDRQTMRPEGAPGPVGVIGTMTESQIRAANQGAGSGGGADGGNAGPGVQQASAPGDLPEGTAAEQYEYARGFLVRRDYDGAAAAFDAFVKAHPEDRLAGNAQYWLGETHYVRGDYAEAARTFAEGFQNYPDSAKAADNLLKLGMSLGALDRKEDACITLRKLRGEYPDAPTSVVQRADREIERLECN